MTTVREAAALLRVDVKTLYAEIRDGRIPHVRIGRVIRISRHVLNAAIKRGSFRPDGTP